MNVLIFFNTPTFLRSITLLKGILQPIFCIDISTHIDREWKKNPIFSKCLSFYRPFLKISLPHYFIFSDCIYLLRRIKSQLEKDVFQLALNKTFCPNPQRLTHQQLKQCQRRNINKTMYSAPSLPLPRFSAQSS